MIVKLALAVLAVVLAAQGYVRLAPLPTDRLTNRPGPMEPGVHPAPGGVKIVRPLAELPPDAVARLTAIAADTPRTTRIGTGDDPAAFVTRSRLWGFPDIILVWVADGNLHLQSHLVFGRNDLGVNAARAARWFEALETAKP